jgi:hypothetical protein
MELTTSGSRDGERMLRANNGTSIKFPKLSRTTNGNLIHLTSNQMVAQPTSDVLLQTQGGGNSSNMKEQTLSMRKVRLLKFKAEKMPRIETLLLETRD